MSQCQASAGLRAVEMGRQAQVCMAGAETRELEASSRGGGRGGSQRRLLGPGPENNGGPSWGKTWESLSRRGPGWQATCFRKASQNLKGGQDGRQAAVGICDHGPGRGPVRSRPSLRHKREWISLEHNLILDGPLEMGGSQDPGPLVGRYWDWRGRGYRGDQHQTDWIWGTCDSTEVQLHMQGKYMWNCWVGDSLGAWHTAGRQ